ncbi:MAG: hypothetical protein ABJH98_06000 [Reichenbachiella sp.]|uniref:hypothetical protein n=1 Tax=Reichenbachiella sp. TaxID=2184521 RepID=UPI003299503B
MFDGKNSKKIDYLEDERRKLWERLTILEKRIEEKPSDIEKEARQASKKAAEYKNKTEERLNQAIEILDRITSTEALLNNKAESISKLKNEIDELNQNSHESSNNITERSDELLSSITKITQILEEHPELENEAEELENVLTGIQENASKATTTYKGILAKKSEIDELHREIIGYEDEDEDGETVNIEGLKAELETAYSELNDNAEKLIDQLESLKTYSKEQFDNFIEENQSEIDNAKEDAKNEYNEINKRISSLLPDALTAGLSSAFIAKKNEEEELFKEYKASFSRGILYLSLVSLLPIAVSVFFLATGSNLIEVVERSPKVILSFLPLYVPLIWTTISANKKVNLSKRLIEEYSHKQVLSMTIEGLSNQIEEIQDNNISEELRIKLLHNFLAVANENPGKLISDYQKSDNPLLNLLDRDKNKDKSIVKTIEDRTKDIIETTADEVEDGIVNSAKNATSQ